MTDPRPRNSQRPNLRKCLSFIVAYQPDIDTDIDTEKGLETLGGIFEKKGVVFEGCMRGEVDVGGDVDADLCDSTVRYMKVKDLRVWGSLVITERFLACKSLLDLSVKGRIQFPPRIPLCCRLQSVDIVDHSLEVLPWEVTLLPLQELSVRSDSLREVPSNIGDLGPTLKNLSLEGPLETLPEEMSELVNLKFLSLSETKLATLPMSLAACSQISTVQLIDNAFQGFQDVFASWPLVTGRRISNASLWDPEDIRRLFQLWPNLDPNFRRE